MTNYPALLEEAVARCRSSIDEHWGDVGTNDDQAVKLSSPLWRLIEALAADPGELAQSRLAHIALFASRRALACWELYCDGDGPQRAIEAVAGWISGDRDGADSDWSRLSVAAVPAYRGKRITDCRFCDTSCAAEAAAHAARFVPSNDCDDAYRCVMFADMAFDQSPLVEADHFRHWLLDIAVPAAFEMRELNPEEREALREYAAADPAAQRDDSEEHVAQSRKATFRRAFDWFSVFIRTRCQP